VSRGCTVVLSTRYVLEFDRMMWSFDGHDALEATAAFRTGVSGC
jgi:hypothetical protein